MKFFIVCDFESFLEPTNSDSDPDARTRIIDEHKVSGFCCHRVTDLPQYQTPPTLYSGPDVMSRFYDHVMSESQTINEILCKPVPMTMTHDRRRHQTTQSGHHLYQLPLGFYA